MRHRSILFALTLPLAALAGCIGSLDGFPRVPVKGTVLVDGRPLAQGRIRFLPAPGVQGRNVEAVVKDGKFALDRRTGPAAGKHRVEIEAAGNVGFELDDEAAYTAYMQTNATLPANPIPPQYNRQSLLSADIPASGNDKLDFTIATR